MANSETKTEEILQQHSDLFKEIAEIKRYIKNDFATALMSNWKPSLSEKLGSFRDHIKSHFSWENDNVFTMLRKARPDDKDAIDALVKQHEEIYGEIEDVIFKLDHKGEWISEDFNRFFDMVDKVLEVLKGHEKKEMELVNKKS